MSSEKKDLSRRTFMKAIAATGAAVYIAPSAFAKQRLPSSPVLDTYIKQTATHWGSVNAIVEGGEFTRVTPFKDDYPIPMIQGLADRVNAQNRVKYPMVREGYLKHGYRSNKAARGRDRFVRVSWEKAFELVAKELKRVKGKYGNSAIFAGSVDWHSVGKLHASPTLLRRMLNQFGGFTDDTGDFSVQAAMTILPHVTGNIEVYDRQTAWPTIIEHTDTVILWAADLLKNNQIGWNPPDHYAYNAVKKLKEKGKKVISIDPRYTDTTEYLNAEWIPIRPNTDVAMMLAIAYTLYKENLYDKKFLDKYTVGFDKFLPYLLGKTDGTPKTPEWAEKITEIKADTIKKIARTMAKGRTMIMSGWAIQRQDHGEQAPWMIVTLAAMLGQIGLPGGGFGFSYHYASGGSPEANAPSLPGISSGDNPVKTEIPFAHAVSDLLLHPGKVIDFNGEKIKYPLIKLVYWAGGNPLSHQMDRNREIKAWRKPDTIIINEIYWTSTAKFADIVLPVTTTFERNDIEVLSEYTNQYIVAMKKTVEPLYEAKSDYDIFAGISRKLGFEKKFTEGKSEMDWIKQFYSVAQKQAKIKKLPMPSFEEFWDKGYVEFPITQEAKEWVRYGDFRKNPLKNPLGTPSGKVEIYSKTIAKFKYDDCPPHPAWMEPIEWLGSKKSKRYPLHMVSSHPKFRLHSQLDNTWLRSLYEINDREPMWINPKDAKKYGIKENDLVMVHNSRGKLLVSAVITDRIREGVILVHEGAWYDPDKPGAIGAMCKHGNPNLVTLDKGTSKLAQGNIANTVLVKVSKYRRTPPKVTVFDVPVGG